MGKAAAVCAAVYFQGLVTSDQRLQNRIHDIAVIAVCVLRVPGILRGAIAEDVIQMAVAVEAVKGFYVFQDGFVIFQVCLVAGPAFKVGGIVGISPVDHVGRPDYKIEGAGIQ